MLALVLKPTPLQNRESKLLLASGSHTRRHMLDNAGLEFETQSPDVDEAPLKQQGLQQGWSASQTALALARAKALAVPAPGAVVIGADQILSCQGQWYDKPADMAQAHTQLMALQGQTHILHTAVVLVRDGQVLWEHVAEPRLTMRPVTEGFVARYLAFEGPQCLSSVGAYRLEGPGIQLFDRIEGDAFAIQGLPLLPLIAALRAIKVLQA